jgi:hypothetical protein
MVAGMVPGLLIGLQRTTAIDYDAVAYRTAAILAEDPGWPVFPAWELSNNPDGVDRIGLAVAKEAPNILSLSKIGKLNEGIFSNEDYRKRIIFGDYPYRFNITLNSTEGKELEIGDSLPGNLSAYGYIRRVVKIKDSPTATINLSSDYAYTYNVSTYNASGSNQTFTVRLNLSELVDKSINPAYQFDPRVEPIDITITNFSAKLNNSQYFFNGIYDFDSVANYTNWTDIGLTAPDNATLTKVRFYKNENPSALPFDYDITDPDMYVFLIENETGVRKPFNLSPSTYVYNNLSLFIHPGTLPIDESTILDITFTFHDVYNETDSTPVPRTLINGTHILNYTRIEQYPLRTAWLEVAIW